MSYAALSLGLFIFIFSYFTLNAPKPNLEPDLSTPEAESVTNFCEIADPGSAPTFQAPADNTTKTGSEDDPALGTVTITSDCKSKGPRHQFSPSLTTYRLIRKSVPLSTTNVKDHTPNFNDESCHFDSSDKVNIDIPAVDKTKFKVFFPQISGEISLDREIYSRTRGKDSNLLYFIDYGLIFLLHLDDKGNFIEHKGGTTQGDSETFYLADIYQDTGSGRPDLPQEAFACGDSIGAKSASGIQIVEPPQSTSSAIDQLQLKYFVFDSKSNQVVNGWGIHCKPAIYLYPPQKQLVNVKVYPSGFLTYTDPPYDFDRGWSVHAYPDGSLFSMNDERITNNYLYFESKIRDEVIKKPTEGWVINSDEFGVGSKEWFKPLENHFNQTLPRLGLNREQTSDFIEYWKKALPFSPYYFVGVIDQRNVNEFERLEITPKPDYINRVRIYFERLDKPKQVEEPSDISLQQSANSEKAEDRQLRADSFSVIEWGGMVKNDPDHPFTCSQ